MTYDFSGKVVLITGGTGALGRACLEDEVVGSTPTRSISSCEETTALE
jgi:FlaA1/EpsC-like NDP-sugar epimerase